MFDFLIFYIHKEQCIAWHTIASLTTVFCFHHLAQLFDSKFSSTHFHQCTYYGTNHIAEETIGADSEAPLIAIQIIPMSLGDGTIVGLGVSIGFGE